MENLLVVLVPVVVAVVVWALNESSRRRWEMYKRKEDRYTSLIQNLEGFSVRSITGEDALHSLRSEFIKQLAYGWLYLPDDLIRKGYEFLDTVRVGANESDQEKNRVLGEFVALMRNDLYGRRLLLWKKTKLVGKDYRHLKSIN